MTAKKPATPSEWVDPDDAPELDLEFFQRADECDGEKWVSRGRPKSDSPKLALTIRYDAEVVEAFRLTGKGWQTRMNDALRDWLKNRSTV